MKKKKLSQWNFGMNTTLCIYTLKRITFKQKQNKTKQTNQKIHLQNGGQMTNFQIASFRIWRKFGKKKGKKTFFRRNFSIKFGS